MCCHSCVNYPCAKEQCQIMRSEMEELRHLLEQHSAAITEMQFLSRQNHQILTLLYSRQFGAFPLNYE